MGYIGPLQWDDDGGHVQMWPEGQRPADIPVISDEEDGDLFDGDHPGIDELGLRILSPARPRCPLFCFTTSLGQSPMTATQWPGSGTTRPRRQQSTRRCHIYRLVI